MQGDCQCTDDKNETKYLKCNSMSITKPLTQEFTDQDFI